MLTFGLGLGPQRIRCVVLCARPSETKRGLTPNQRTAGMRQDLQLATCMLHCKTKQLAVIKNARVVPSCTDGQGDEHGNGLET